MDKANPLQGWQVFLWHKEIDVVWMSPSDTADDVKRSLTDHDGYHPEITLKKLK